MRAGRQPSCAPARGPPFLPSPPSTRPGTRGCGLLQCRARCLLFLIPRGNRLPFVLHRLNSDDPRPPLETRHWGRVSAPPPPSFAPFLNPLPSKTVCPGQRWPCHTALSLMGGPEGTPLQLSDILGTSCCSSSRPNVPLPGMVGAMVASPPPRARTGPALCRTTKPAPALHFSLPSRQPFAGVCRRSGWQRSGVICHGCSLHRCHLCRIAARYICAFSCTL